MILRLLIKSLTPLFADVVAVVSWDVTESRADAAVLSSPFQTVCKFVAHEELAVLLNAQLSVDARHVAKPTNALKLVIV